MTVMARSPERWISPLAAPTALLALALLAGCAGTSSKLADVRYDFGPPAPVTNAGTMPMVKVLDVTAADMPDTNQLVYRLSYADGQRTASYANAHWTMPPSQLLSQRLRNVLSAHGTVLTGGDGVRAPVLKVDLTEFEQVFNSQTESHGAITARVTLFHSGKVIAQRTFSAQAPSSSPDAHGGAQALAAASDDLVAQIAAWVGTQPLVAAE
jgi:cholesterol transport system auxiliary component